MPFLYAISDLVDVSLMSIWARERYSCIVLISNVVCSFISHMEPWSESSSYCIHSLLGYLLFTGKVFIVYGSVSERQDVPKTLTYHQKS